MKKLLLAVTVAAFATSASANEILGPSSVINFNGKLEAPTCQIDQTTNKQITFAPVYAPEATNAEAKEFTIHLTGCTPFLDKNVTLKFTSEDTDLVTAGSEKVLKNTAPEGQDAKNVGIKVVAVNDQQTETNVFNGEKELAPYSELNTGDIRFNFKAKYVKLNDSAEVQPGLISGSLPFTVVYK